MGRKEKGYGPGYLAAEDLIAGGKWQEKIFTVKGLMPPNQVEAADGSLIEHPILELNETPKRFILSARCNRTLLKHETGAGTATEIIGQRIVLYPVLGVWKIGSPYALRVRFTRDAQGPRIPPKDMGKDITGVVIRDLRPPQPVSDEPSTEEQQRIQEMENNQ